MMVLWPNNFSPLLGLLFFLGFFHQSVDGEHGANVQGEKCPPSPAFRPGVTYTYNWRHKVGIGVEGKQVVADVEADLVLRCICASHGGWWMEARLPHARATACVGAF